MPGRYGAKGVKRRTYRRKTKRMGYRKKAKKPLFRGGPTTAIIKSPSGISDRLRVKLRAWATFSYTQAPGNFGVAAVTGNNAEDIYTAGGGGAANYWASYTNLYERYVVTGCKVDTLNALNNATNGPANTMSYITPSPDSASFSSLEKIEENRWTKRSNMKVYAIGIGSNHQSYYMSSARALGVPKRAITGDPDYAGTTSGTAPNKMWHWHLTNYVQGGSITQSLIQEVRLTYYITFFSPKREA